MSKKIVRYKTLHLCAVGKPAIVEPVDHPDSGKVSNTGPVLTSKVLQYDVLSGNFETENTQYMPVASGV